MSAAPDFLDSNILVYAYDSRNIQKQQIARRLLHEALSGRFVISTQVLAEFAAVLLHKFSPPLSVKQLLIALNTLQLIRVIVPDAGVVRRAVEAHENYGVRFYDGMIVAVAEKAGCPRILSEDFNSGQEYFGIRIENPFR